MIEAMGFSREQVYIANIIKCRPPGNRNPEPDEIQSCEPFLKKQIASIRPRVMTARTSVTEKVNIAASRQAAMASGR